MTAGRLWAVTVIVAALLLASLALAGVQMWWHKQGHTSVLPVPVETTAEPVGTSAPRDLAAIAAIAPFGETPIAASQQRSTQTPAEINVALRGVLLDSDPTQSRAFLSSGGTTATYRMGDAVQSAELVAINAATITLRLEEQFLVVGFDGLIDGQASQNDDQPIPTPEEPGDPFARLAAAIVPGNGSIELRDTPPPETTDEYIDLWRARIMTNPQASMDAVGVELVENGYRIKPDPDIGVTLAGLKPGDVITALNGQIVGDLARDRELYDEVTAAGIARLEVLRDGRAILLTFPLR